MTFKEVLILSDGTRIIKDENGDLFTISKISNNSPTVRTHTAISLTLIELGIPQNTTGFTYMETALDYLTKFSKLKRTLLGHLYILIAKKHNTTVENVNRSIHSVINSIDCLNNPLYHKIFGKKILVHNDIDFITILSQYLRNL